MARKTGIGPRLILALGAFMVLLGGIIFHAEGTYGFPPFLNLEAWSVVVFGTFLSVWSAYPLKTMFALEDPRMLAYAADSAIVMGYFGTLLGIMLLLSGVEDLVAVPRRIALALDALFFAVILSRLVFRPLAENASG